MGRMDISVKDCASILKPRPVTGGVPIACGEAPPGTVFALRDAGGNPVPLQWEVTGRWDDGSARWLLLDFQSTPPAGGRSDYVLSWDVEADGAPDEAPSDAGKRPGCVGSGDACVSAVEGGLLAIGKRLELSLRLADAAGELCRAHVDNVRVVRAGPLRPTLRLEGAFHRPDGSRWFSFRLDASVFTGLPLIHLEPLIVLDADSGVMQRICELSLVVTPVDGSHGGRIGCAPPHEVAVGESARLLQVDDRQVEVDGQTRDERAPGWAEMDDASGTIAVALRDFWQQWPKSIELDGDGLTISPLPSFETGRFDHVEPWYKYQYLFAGDCYQLRTGQARSWDIWIGLQGDGPGLAAAANAPLIPIPEPAQAIATGVWGQILPAGTPETAEYDDWAQSLFEAYLRSIEKQRDYGAMNWGDWFGERIVNWGNHEYDTTNQLLIQFARTGDPRYFYVADAAARHSAEVDTVHHVNADLWNHFAEIEGDPEAYEDTEPAYPFRPGMVHQHTVGHVSGFYSIQTVRELFIEKGIGLPPNPYLCLSPTNLGHLWTQGTSRHSFLSGNSFVRETVLTIGDNLARLVEDGKYPFLGHSHMGRIAGWTSLALAGAYEIDFDRRFLDAMRGIAEGAMEEQDPNCGGWLYYPMPEGHCYCKKHKHTGMAGFITAVLINGLSRYYGLSGDERLKPCIDAGVRFLDLDTWHEQWRGWRYTSCPATALNGVGQPGVTMMAHVNGALIGDDPEHLRILKVAWDEKFSKLLDEDTTAQGFGKAYASTMYGCPETVAVLASMEAPETSTPYGKR